MKDAPSMTDTERRYLNVALLETSHNHLSLGVKIMGDRNAQGHKSIWDDADMFSIDEVAKPVEAELKGLGSDH